ncbi:hypothetical protein DEJ39_01625 [Bacteroidetes bacterium SCGC AAA795-G10]|nr:hypothetical protein DEJ39_01625 [Bacteroidetes bacterium SCGC AAA795-G10]
MKMKIDLFYIFVLITFKFGISQTGEVTNHIYEGNKKVKTEAYVEAEKSYRKAISLAPEKSEALYNLGNTHFLDEKYDEASQRFFQSQKFAKNKESKHRAFHNMGNVYMQKKEYQNAVEAYKNALRNDPSDEETRYNYALAKELLEKDKPPEEQEQDNKDQEKKEDQNEKEEDKGNQDQKNEDPKNDGDDGEESNKENEPKNEGDQKKDKNQDQKQEKPEDKKQTPKQGQLSPQQVQSLLEAMNNQEEKVQDKINAKKLKGAPIKGEKDW